MWRIQLGRLTVYVEVNRCGSSSFDNRLQLEWHSVDRIPLSGAVDPAKCLLLNNQCRGESLGPPNRTLTRGYRQNLLSWPICHLSADFYEN